MSQPANDEFSKHLSDDKESNHKDASDTGAAPKQQQQVIPQITAILNIKLPILKKEEYDICNSEMETLRKEISLERWYVRILITITAAEIQAVEKERKAKNILLMAIPKEHMRRFHRMDDAKENWEAIRTTFGGNANSKKMQKAVFKQQFEAFKISNSEGLENGYDRFQQFSSQLELKVREVSTEDEIISFSDLPPSMVHIWQMTIRTKPEVDTLSINDLYNNLRVFEQEIQGASKTSSSAQNVAFVSQSKSNTNKVKSGFTGAYSTCTPSTSSTIFLKRNLEQIDDLDIEEMDINWQIAMIAIRMKKFYKKTGRRVCVDGKTPVGFDKKKLECFNCHNTGHFARECTAKGTNDGKKKRDSFYQHQEAGKQEKSQMGLLTMDDGICRDLVELPLKQSGDPESEFQVTSKEQPIKDQATPKVNRKNWNAMMERELGEEQRVVNTGNGVAKPVWTNANRVNHANKLVPRSVQINAGRPNINTVRPNINTGRTNINSVRPNINTGRTNINPVRPRVNTGSSNVNTVRSRQPDHPLKNMVDRGIFDSGCSGHMTGNKDQLEDFEEFNGGSVTFGGSKGYISGKGKIRVGNLDFDSVSFVKELGHFNLFSISQICDKQHKVLFTETECLVVSSDFKMPDENQILLKVPRHHNMYSFDMKTPTPAKGFACLIAKATSDESKLWHRRFSWVFFLASKDETSGILQNFIRQIENQLSHRVKIIRSDNDTEFKNRDMLKFCGNKGIKQEYSNARTPQQIGLAERMNRTLIEAARTMLADSLLPTTFWAEAVSTACYIFNRVRVTKPQNKTPYELLFGHKPIISYIRPFGCHVTILDTLSVLGKFDGKSDEGFLVGYSLNSKAYRVYNLVTKRVEVNLHVNFLEDKPNVKGVGYRWMFDIDYLTDSMNYIPVSLENQANPHAGASEVTNSAGTSQTPSFNASEEKDEDVELIVVPSTVRNTEEKAESRKSSTNSKKEEILTELQQEKKASSTDTSEDNPKILAFRRELEEIALKHLGKVSENTTTSTTSVNTGSEPVNTGSFDPDDSPMPELEIFHKSETGIFDEASYDEEGVITDFNSLPTEIEVSPTPTLRIHNIHPKSQILGDPKSAVQTRSKVQQKSGAHALFSFIQKQQRNNHKDQQHCYLLGFSITPRRNSKKICESLQR
ncbi:ribonuclease H-like domain-containing protein [Tanacetum coccineum]